uniref:Protein cueball n=2 Tax=Culex pipiens TaxID=7175 RepID=A0A8D7ZYA3_CULPI
MKWERMVPVGTRSLLLSLLAVVGYVTGLDWDSIITTDSGILFFDQNWTQVSSGGHQFQHISAFAYDEVKQKLYFSDLKDPKFRIFSLDANPQEEYHKVTKLLPKSDETAYITGLVFDHLERKLYWTERGTHALYSVEVDKIGNVTDAGSLISTVTKVEDNHDLAGLAIDECRRHLYWTNSYLQTSNVVRATMAGKVLNSHTEDVYEPKGIAVDHYSNRIYWVEKKFGRAFSIQSVNLEVEDVKTFISENDKAPTHVALNSRYLYWVDQQVGEVHETLKSDSTQSRVVYRGNRPTAIIIKSSLLLNHQNNNPSCKSVIAKILDNVKRESDGELPQADKPTSTKPEMIICLNNGILNHNTNSCICLPEYQGNFCEIPICNNYCVHGKCVIGRDNRPTCECDAKFEGERCDRSKCDGFCLNSGNCSFSDATATCACPKNFSGKRCETAICTSDYCYNGRCMVEEGGSPKCQCNVGYRGERCEEYTCNNYCLNDGKCVLNNETMLVECRCGAEYTGKRCEIPKRFCSLDTGNPELQPYCDGIQLSSQQQQQQQLVEPQISYCKNSFNRTVVYASLAFAASLFILMVILLIVRRFYEEGRPRITKRFKVTSNHTQMTSRPATQCEITIENCCNMNVCETPCFDTNLLQKSSSKAEDKQYLLDDIENIAGSYRKLPSCAGGDKNLP